MTATIEVLTSVVDKLFCTKMLVLRVEAWRRRDGHDFIRPHGRRGLGPVSQSFGGPAGLAAHLHPSCILPVNVRQEGGASCASVKLSWPSVSLLAL